MSFYYSWTFPNSNIFLYPMVYMMSEINLSFILFSFSINKRYTQALNQIVKLTRKIRHLDLNRSEFFYPYIPVIIISMKMIFGFKWFFGMSTFSVLSVVYILIKVSLDVMLYTWLLCVEKIIIKINRRIRNNSLLLTVRQLQPLMLYFFDVQDFIFFISESVGLPHLILTVNTLIANILYIHKYLPNFVESFRRLNIGTVIETIYLIEWQLRVYTFLMFCYRSQRINEAVCAKVHYVYFLNYVFLKLREPTYLQLGLRPRSIPPFNNIAHRPHRHPCSS